MDNKDRVEQLENEIRLMALDNMMIERAYEMLRQKLECLYKDMRLTSGVRMECYDAVADVKTFLEFGHESLRGMKDAAGNDIRI